MNNRGGKNDPARMPSAPASLRVQLSPTELLSERKPKQQLSVRDMLQRRRPVAPPAPRAPAKGASPSSHREAGPSTTSDACQDTQQTNSIPPADARELAASVLLHQQRRRKVLAAQEALILVPSVTVPALKQSLTVFGPASWTQVNHERHLAGSCGYPLCSRPPRKAEISQRPRPRIGANGRVQRGTNHEAPFRLSVSKGTVERNTADDPGGKNAFCADGCWARSEWVRRWVLSDELRDPVLQAARTSSEPPSAPLSKTSIFAAAAADGGAEGRAQAGRFERAWDHSDWESIELLDDVHPEVTLRLDGDNPPPFAMAYQPRTPTALGQATRDSPLSKTSTGATSDSAARKETTRTPSRPMASDLTKPGGPAPPRPIGASVPAPCPSDTTSKECHKEVLMDATLKAQPANDQLTRKMYTETTPHPLGDMVAQGQVSDPRSLVEEMVIQERPHCNASISNNIMLQDPAGTGFHAAAHAALDGPSNRPASQLIYARPPVGLNELLGFGGLADGISRQVPLQSRTATTMAQNQSNVTSVARPPNSLSMPSSTDPDLAVLFDAALQIRKEEQSSGNFDPNVSLGAIRDQWAKRNCTS